MTAIVEFPNSQILLIKRRTVVFKGYWALPGGRVDEGESLKHAIVREVREETGLQVKVIKKIGEYHEKGVQDNIEYDYLATCFHVKPIGGKMKRQEMEVEMIKLIKPRKLQRKLAFRHFNMIKDFINLAKIK
ncbi:MAG: NUDIX domain-containing protein [Candidatus Bathyarchaeota archaeon]|nr:MAG: NUDIX domain-containing protein [Candidatus Bathyarchaeota archaeon]